MKQRKKGTIKRREPHIELEGHIHIYVKTSKLFFITPQFQALEILARLSTGWRGQTDDHPRQWTLPESGCKRNLFVIHIGVMGYRRCAPRLQLYMFEYILFISPVSLLFFYSFSAFSLPFFSISLPSSLPSLFPSLSPPLFFSFSFLPGCRDAILGSWTEWREEPSTNSVHHALQQCFTMVGHIYS